MTTILTLLEPLLQEAAILEADQIPRISRTPDVATEAAEKGVHLYFFEQRGNKFD